MNVSYVGIDDIKIISCFSEVLEKYEDLHRFKILLKRKKLKSASMMAQPIFDGKNIFAKIKQYQILLGFHLRGAIDIPINSLPDDVLKGWFAHELGHIIDYTQRSNTGILLFGIKYLISKPFMRAAEYRADTIAIKHGFRNEIIATKRFILEHELLDGRYKDKIKNYYMSIEQVQLSSQEEIPIIPAVEL